jgi:sugar transferase (PEP-CTERM/EpsH1 system associated)
MNILYIAHRIPYPPDKGEKIRTFHQIRHLSQNHTIHLVCLVDEPADLIHVQSLEKWCASVGAVYRSKARALLSAASALLTWKPLSVAAFQQKKLAEEITQQLSTERFDALVITSSALAEYILHVSNISRVIDFIDVDSEKWRLYAQYHSFPLSLIYKLEATRLARYEEKIARVFDHAILISEEERCLFQKRVSDRPVSVISNGVDLEYFAASDVEPHPTSQPTIVFIGIMDYFPNVDAVQYFCREIFPLVRKSVPAVQFYIVGRNPTREVKALGNQPQVFVTGAVPDVRPYLAQAMVAVAPFRLARGVQNKILEAMAMGVPVVGTAEAFNGIRATEKDGISVVDDPQHFAQEVTTLLTANTDSRRWHAQRARHYTECQHRWEEQGTKLERLLEKAVREFATERHLGSSAALWSRSLSENTQDFSSD